MALAAIESFMSISQLVEMSIGTDKGRWWADTDFGSTLWILRQSGKAGPSLASDVKQSIIDSVAWIKDDGLAKDIVVETEAVGKTRINWAVTVTRPDGSTVLIKDVWDGL